MYQPLRRPVPLLALLLGMFALIAAACGSDSPPQTLSLNIKVDPTSLDPAHGIGTESISVQRQLFRGLVRFDEDLAIVPDVAEVVPSVENGGLSEDGRTYVFRIRDEAAWSDGGR